MLSGESDKKRDLEIFSSEWERGGDDDDVKIGERVWDAIPLASNRYSSYSIEPMNVRLTNLSLDARALSLTTACVLPFLISKLICFWIFH